MCEACERHVKASKMRLLQSTVTTTNQHSIDIFRVELEPVKSSKVRNWINVANEARVFLVLSSHLCSAIISQWQPQKSDTKKEKEAKLVRKKKQKVSPDVVFVISCCANPFDHFSWLDELAHFSVSKWNSRKKISLRFLPVRHEFN